MKRLFITALTLTLFPISAHAAPAILDRLEASVNSSLILLSDVAKFRRTVKLRSQLDPLFAGTAVAAKGDNAEVGEIVDFLVNERLISQAFPVTDAEAEQAINDIQVNNKIDRGQLKSALSDQGFAFEEYFEMIRASKSKATLIDRDISTKVTISEDDVKNYFVNHYAKSSAIPMSYKFQILSFSISNYKNANAARDTATRALKELRAGEPFDEVAKRFSVESTGEGDISTLSEDQMSPAIRDQVKKLQIGRVSDVFGSPQAGAFYVIKLLDVKSGDSERFNKMKQEIRSQLAASEYQHQIQLWIDRQRQNAFIHRAGEASTAGLPVMPSQ